MTTKKYPARGLLFDLDGTLVDSAPDLNANIIRMLDQLGQPSRSVEDIRQWVGNGAPKLVKRALTGQLEGEPDPGLFARALPLFYQLYATHICEKSVLYDGVTETLEAFNSQGFQMACVTNKPGQHTELLLEAIGLRHFFGSIVAGDTLPVKKPDPAPLLHAAREIEVKAADCIMIGDSPADIRAASAAQMPMLCLTYGYNQGADLSATSADQLVDSFPALADWIRYA